MEENDTNKYLRFVQACGVKHSKVKESLSREFNARRKKLMTIELNRKNLIDAINSTILIWSSGVDND